MQRWTALFFLALVAVAVVLVVVARPLPGSASASADLSASASAQASAQTPGPLTIIAPTTIPGPVLPLDIDAGPLPPFSDDPGENRDAGTTLADGTPVPALGPDAPKQVLFGVVLIQYRGAQGAPRDAKSREEALESATKLAALAKEDFAAAVKQADVGAENAGSMIRNVLEPGPEYTLFSLEVGAVGGPVDSPRGFYIFKRVE